MRISWYAPASSGPTERRECLTKAIWAKLACALIVSKVTGVGNLCWTVISTASQLGSVLVGSG